MLCITHAVIGGAVASTVSGPMVAFVLGIISHLIIDKIPHFWPKTKEKQHIQMLLDGVGSLSIFIFILLYPFQNQNVLLAGALGGISVDIVFVLVPMVFTPFNDNKLRVWHEKRQYHKDRLVYLWSDIILIIIGLIIILGK